MREAENTVFGQNVSRVKAMKGVAVLVVGDIMLDRFVYGSVERISPESPVPVLQVAREDHMLGGAGNALANINSLEARGVVLAVVGDDQEGKTVREKAEKLGADVSGLLVDSDRPTIVKTRYLAGHQQLLRTDFEKKTDVSDDIAAQLLQRAEALVKTVQAVIISDYGKGVLRRDVLAALIGMAKAQNIPVIVDPKGRDFSIYEGASAITPNKKELSEATKGHSIETDEDIVEAARGIIESCGIETVIATRSKDGISIIQKEGTPVHLQTRNIEVFDVSGAGDTVIATIACALAAGADMVEAAALANVAGSVVVTKVGTASIRASELIEALETGYEHEPVSRVGKARGLSSWDEAAEQIRRWKARGLKVGFTNGCFDILHYGHVTYLNDARSHCDRLIVGLNRDSSVSVLKGPARPVHDENSRAAVLGALGCVDMVVLFGAHRAGEDNTAITLLEVLHPDVYFKGGDYTEEQIPEAPTVRKYGGDVRVMPVYEGHSTTGSIKKMASEAGNALWFILIAIALMGILTMVLSRGSSSVDQSADVERNRVRSSQILRYAKSVETAIQNMRLRGVSERDISFENPVTATDYTNARCTSSECKVFDVGGGGLTYREFTEANGGSDWIFTGDNNVGTTAGPIETTAAGTGNDLLMLMPDIDSALCIQINRDLDVGTPGTLPTDAGGIVTTAFTGTYDNSVLTILDGDPAPFELDKHNAGCFVDTLPNPDVTYFYYVLLAR